MYEISQRRIRLSTLAAATAVAITAMCAPAFAGGVDLAALKTADKFDRFIVKYRDGSPERGNATALQSSLNRAAGAVPAAKGRALGLKKLRRLAIPMELVQADRQLDRAEAETLMRQLAADPNVEHVEPDVMMKALGTPNDTRYAEQWHYYEATGGLNLPSAWNRSTGTGVVVAVVDTGILSHADLNANILPGYDMVASVSGGQCPDGTSGCGASGDGGGRDADPTDASNEQHGTHVAGTIAAVTNNASGVAGVAYGARVVPVRVLGKGGYGNTSDIVDGIVWAAGGTVTGVPANANPAEVINLSLGGQSTCTSSSAYQTAINTAVGRGTTVVVAAGNSNMDVSGFSPAGCANVIAVAASDKEGDRAFYSNYGAKIDVTAPGGETCSPNLRFLALGATPYCNVDHPSKGILSTVSGGGYAFYQGTSMAAPHVAGVVALMQAAAASPMTPAQVESTLKSTVRAIPTANCPGGCGAGFVNADAAVAAAAGGSAGNVAPVANFTSSVSGLTVSFTDSSTDSDGSIASRSWNFGDGTTSTATSPSKTYAAAGTYTVTLTVTDNGGATNTKTATVTVAASGSNTLSNGVPVTGLSGAAGTALRYTMNVPAGATNLKFVTSGGSGDADLYARFNAQPTTSTADCKSEGGTTAETCSIATAQAGTYHVLVSAYSAISGVSLTGSYSTGGGTTQTYTNSGDYAINDNATVESPITVSGRSGNASSTTKVAVAIVHTYIGDLKVDLIASDGSVYVLHNRSGTSTDNINSTYTVNVSTETLNGTWKLRVNDNAAGDTGYVNSWSITF